MTTYQHITPPKNGQKIAVNKDFTLNVEFTQWLKNENATHRFVLSPYSQKTLSDEKSPGDASVVFVVGPEGGLSTQEVELAMQHRFVPIKLGARILRTETAAIAGLAVLQYQWGDMK